MYYLHNQTGTMQHLTVLDKCTQIIREDRIWLRNLIKANNQDVLNLFKGLPKIPNMKQLQIKLRKYINRAKQRQKQEQLSKFKENMQLPEFAEATQKRNEPYPHNKSQTKFKSPLLQNQGNAQKSSFVAKWNNYTHHNYSNNFIQSKSQLSQINSIFQNDKSLKKQWINNYKPHSFNQNLNGQLSNKLSYKNKSASNLKRNNQVSHFSKQKSYYKRNDQFQNMNSTQGFGTNGRNSSKSLKQLQNKIYQELRQFQQNKKIKQAEIMDKAHLQQSFDRCFQKQKPSFKQLQTLYQQSQKSVNFSKQNIDQILKFKLGNCDFQTYKKQKSFQNQQDQEHCLRQKDSSQKKLYNDGLFPPIEQQTERDSQSQRYAEEPLRFGIISSKQQVQDRHKFTFSSFAKVSPDQLKQSFKVNQVSESHMSSQNKNNATQFYENQRGLKEIQHQDYVQKNQINLIKGNYQEPLPQNFISESLYESGQKLIHAHDQYIESDLHKSIMSSIRKSRKDFPNQVFSSNLTNGQNYDNSIQKVFSQNTNIANQLPVPINFQFVSISQMDAPIKKQKNESLFTSPELLNECRNFLKKTQQINFQNSGVGNFNSSVKNTIYQSPPNSQQKSSRQMFSNQNVKNFPQPITITQSITKQYYENDSALNINSLFESKQSSLNKTNKVDFQTYSKPSHFNQNSFKKSQFVQSSVKNSNEKEKLNDTLTINQDKKIQKHVRGNSSVKRHSQIEETIAFPSNQLFLVRQDLQNKGNSEQQQLTRTDKYQTSEFNNFLNRQAQKNNQKKLVQIQNIIDLEDIIDTILQANEGNIQVESSWLKHSLDNRCIFTEQVGYTLKDILREYVEGSHTYNFIEVINQIQDHYKKNANYQPRKCPSRDIYLLLDIQQKGFITSTDIKNFIQQLQEAQVQNLAQIRANLLEVFQLADFMSIKRISYINLYIIKNQDSFDKLCEDLQQFQFQIEGQQ